MIKPKVGLPFSAREPRGWLMPALLCSAGALNSFSITLLGRLTIGEILVIATFPFVAVLSPTKLKGLAVLFAALMAYLSSAVITDILRQSAFEDYARGWAKLLVLGLGVLWLLKASSNSWLLLRYFFAGLAVAPLINYARGSSIELDFWKFTLGPSVTMLIGVWVTFRGHSYTDNRLAFIYLVLGVAHFFGNSRSLGTLTLFTGLMILLGSPRMVKLLASKGVAPVVAGVTCCIFFGYGLLSAYEYTADQGYLGETAKEKYDLQTGGGKNMVFSARSEYVASWAAIADSPLIGHGSWAKNSKYIELLLAEQGIDLSSGQALSFIQTELIPTHSHIFGAWVEAGVVGAIFWLYILAMAIRALIRVRQPEFRLLRPLVAYLALTMIFDVFFSPFGLERRMTDAGIISGFLIILTSHRLRWGANPIHQFPGRKSLSRIPVMKVPQSIIGS